jgi:hypothetical protein
MKLKVSRMSEIKGRHDRSGNLGCAGKVDWWERKGGMK